MNEKDEKGKRKEQRKRDPRLSERVPFPLLLRYMTSVIKMAESLQICHTDSQRSAEGSHKIRGGRPHKWYLPHNLLTISICY